MSGSVTISNQPTTVNTDVTTDPFKPYQILTAQELNTALKTGNKTGGILDNVQIGVNEPATGVFTSLIAPTMPAGDSSTHVATTAFVIAHGGGGGGGGGPSITIPSAQLLGGTGSALTPVTVSTGLLLQNGVLTNTVTQTAPLTVPNSTLVGGNGSTLTSVPLGAGLTMVNGQLTVTVQGGSGSLAVPNAQLIGGNGTALSGVTVGGGLSLTSGTLKASVPTSTLLGGNGTTFTSVGLGSGITLSNGLLVVDTSGATAGLAPLSSPTFTGTPTISGSPPASSDSSTKIATTAFVQSQLQQTVTATSLDGNGGAGIVAVDAAGAPSIQNTIMFPAFNIPIAQLVGNQTYTIAVPFACRISQVNAGVFNASSSNNVTCSFKVNGSNIAGLGGIVVIGYTGHVATSAALLAPGDQFSVVIDLISGTLPADSVLNVQPFGAYA